MTHRSCPDYQSMCSPYRLGVSPRMKASNVLFSTADQSTSRLSSDNLSVHSPSSSTAPAVVRAIRSPLMKRGPRSGQCRIGSNGCHLKAAVSALEAKSLRPTYQKLWKWYEKEPLKKPSNPKACGAALFWAGVLKKSPNLKSHMSKRRPPPQNAKLTLGNTAGVAGPSGKTQCSTKPRRRAHREASTTALPNARPWYIWTPSSGGNPTRSSKPS